jgi:hypothetical protein
MRSGLHYQIQQPSNILRQHKNTCLKVHPVSRSFARCKVFWINLSTQAVI